MLKIAGRCLAICTSLIADSTAQAVSCASEPVDTRFDAVCALAPRSWPADATWRPEGSGVLVAPNLIITARHVVSTSPSPPSGNCDIQQNNWYAYFRGCPTPCSSCPCYPLCVGANEDMIRVRIKCFTIATGEFYGPLGYTPGNYYESVIVGEIEPDEVCFVSHITPIPVVRPHDPDVDLCQGKPVYLAGWGKTLPVFCEGAGGAGRLRVATTTISYVGCERTGRSGPIGIVVGPCFSASPCIPNAGLHDSGGGVIVELPDGSLGVVGVMETTGSMIGVAHMAARHQAITTQGGTEILCRPCRGLPCGDINRNGIVNCEDRECLESLGPWMVTPWCLGDLDGDGVAGTQADVDRVDCDPKNPDNFSVCNRNQWCFGDANLDGYVTLADATLIEQIRATGFEGVYSCPTCHACPPPFEWCRADVNYDGFVDQIDAGIVADLLVGNQAGYACSDSAPGCATAGSCE